MLEGNEHVCTAGHRPTIWGLNFQFKFFPMWATLDRISGFFQISLKPWPVEYHIFPFGWVSSGIAQIRSFKFFNKYESSSKNRNKENEMGKKRYVCQIWDNCSLGFHGLTLMNCPWLSGVLCWMGLSNWEGCNGFGNSLPWGEGKESVDKLASYLSTFTPFLKSHIN